MIELSETEINVVSGGEWTPTVWRTSYNASDMMSQLMSQWHACERGKNHLIAHRLKEYRAANPDSPTWHADFFGF